MNKPRVYDSKHRLVLSLVNAWAYVRHFQLLRRFRRHLGYWPRVAIPRSFNEKLLWRKLFDHNPQFVTFCDKLESKRWFAARCPDLPVAGLLWSGEDPGDLPAGLLRRRVVVKATHGCGFNYVIGDTAPDHASLVVSLRRWLATTYGQRHGEWAYSQVLPRLLVEERVDLPGAPPMIDVKAMTFNGDVAMLVVTQGEKTARESSGLFDPQGVRLASSRVKDGKGEGELPADFSLPVPAQLIADLAARLADDLDFARVDFMCSGDHLAAGEITVYPGAGYRRYSDPAIAQRLTALWDLRRSWFLTHPHRGWRGAYARALRARLDAAEATA